MCINISIRSGFTIESTISLEAGETASTNVIDIYVAKSPYGSWNNCWYISSVLREKNTDVYFLVDIADRRVISKGGTGANSDIGRSAKLARIELAGIK